MTDSLQLNVSLGERSYEIRIGRRLVDFVRESVERYMETGSRVFVVTDENVYQVQKKFFEEAFPGIEVYRVAPGETAKSFQQLEQCCEALAKAGVDRSGVLYSVGGGVVGDLGGFAAAAYLRGIRFYQVPTTLLAMVDSSVGGKTGINLQAGKNLVGAFHQPLGVFADTALLETLPDREFSAGMAEIIKHGMLADAGLFEELESLPRLTPGHPGMPEIVRRNCAIKASVVEADERESASSGGRALLNLGHTFGHAIERIHGYGNLLHGEAVAIGLVLAAELSRQLGTVSQNDVDRVRAVVEKYALPTHLSESFQVADLMDAMSRDKKVRQGNWRLVTLARLGQAETRGDVSHSLIETIWKTAGAV